MEMETYKLIFPPETTKEQMEETIARHAKEYKLYNTQVNVGIGGIRVSFAVVDLPDKSVPAFAGKCQIESMGGERRKPSCGAECDGGGGG